MTKNAIARDCVFLIEKIDDETFITGFENGYLELINKKELTYLSLLKLEGVSDIN